MARRKSAADLAAEEGKPARAQKQKQRADQLTDSDPRSVLNATRPSRVMGFSALDARQYVIGIPLRALSLRLLFQNDCLPLGRVLHIYGPTESLKSSLSFELMRLICANGGGGLYILNEPRDQPTLRESIFGNNKDLLDAVDVVPTKSLEQWQDVVTGMLKSCRDMYGAGGLCFPFALVVDSVLGTASQDVIDNIWECGHAEIGYAKEANILNTYMKFVPQQIADQPLFLMLTNHQKEAIDQKAGPFQAKQWKTPGGASLNFYTTFGLEMRKIGADFRKADGTAGRQVTIRTKKNSLGDARFSILVSMSWYKDVMKDEDGNEHVVQNTTWDWHGSTVDILMKCAFAGDATAGAWKKKVAEIVDLQAEAHNSNKISSKVLGLVKEEPYIVGEAIEANDKIRVALDQLFGIQKVRPFELKRTYSSQLEDLKAAVSEGYWRAHQLREDNIDAE